MHVIIGEEVEQRQEIFISQIYPRLMQSRTEPTRLWIFTDEQRVDAYRDFFPEAHYYVDSWEKTLDLLQWKSEHYMPLLDTHSYQILVIDHPELEVGTRNNLYGVISYPHLKRLIVKMDHQIQLSRWPQFFRPVLWLTQPVLDLERQLRETTWSYSYSPPNPLEEWWAGGQIVIFTYDMFGYHYYHLKWEEQSELERWCRFQQQQLESELAQQRIAPDELSFWESNQKTHPVVSPYEEYLLERELGQSQRVGFT